MRPVAAALVLVSLACTAGPKGGPPDALDGPVGFRVLSESENATPCADAPDVMVAADEDAWIDAFDQQSSCRSDDTIDLPEVDFRTEVAVAIWWKREGCLGYTVHTDAAERVRGVIEVRAHTTGPSGACATAVGQVESFLALPRSDRFDGTQPVRAVLDGAVVAAETPRATPT